MWVPDNRAFALAPTFEAYQNQLRTMVYVTEALPESIQQELKNVYDVLELCYVKYDLLELAQLYAVMVFEKALRIKLETEYKNIAKIKLSVLLDRAKQLALLDAEDIAILRTLKDFRNRGVHQSSEAGDGVLVMSYVELLMRAVHQLFTNTPLTIL